MVQPRAGLSAMSGEVFLTDSGIETDLIYNHGLDLPDFAPFPLLETAEGRATLQQYFREHLDVARERGLGVVFETPTWRASPDWGARLGYDLSQLAVLNEQAVDLLLNLRDTAGAGMSFVISGTLGPRHDGYDAEAVMTADQAAEYHSWQVGVLTASGVDVISAFTIDYVAEGLGIVNASAEAQVPSVISFTTDEQGDLPDGSSVAGAIERIDVEAVAPPAYYMLNCTHPQHITRMLSEGGQWRDRLRGLRANSSPSGLVEPPAGQPLDPGDIEEFGLLMRQVHELAPSVTILGGCCGTDVRHIRAIADAVR
ncbi:MAG: homocysteine S-methyltransferase family protein [Actinomycetes bacterium]